MADIVATGPLFAPHTLRNAPAPQQIGNADADGAEAQRIKVIPATIPQPFRCLFNTPCCGGCCAPTVNPDETCARRASNEFSLPANGGFLKLAPVIEYSPCCRFCGRMGFDVFARHRRNLMMCAFFVSLTGWILTALSAIALSSEPGVVSQQLGHWASGEIYQEATGDTVLKIYIGVSSRVEQLDCAATPNSTACTENMLTAPGFVHSHDDVYIRGTDWGNDAQCGAAPPVDMPDQAVGALGALGTIICGECKKNAEASWSLLAIGLVSQVGQMATNLQRRTPFGDVNCQATMGTVSSFLGGLSTLGSLTAFSTACFDGLPIDLPGVDTVKMRWSLGSAYNCLLFATFLKFVDGIMHCLTPTPKARWQKPPRDIENLEEFLMLAT